MSEKYFRGKITFINHEKQKATIEYVTGNKIKNIQAVIDEKQQEKYIELKLIKKAHRFIPGDHVKFVIKKSANGAFFADHVIYEFNNALQVLVEKSILNNNFQGYVKIVDDKYFIKEIESYLFFPLRISRYEIAPEVSESDKAVRFKLINTENPAKVSAELYNRHYTPEYLATIKLYKKEEAVIGRVTKITPYGMFLTLTSSGMECKIAMNESVQEKINQLQIVPDSLLKVKIIHISPDRVIVEWEEMNNRQQ